MNPNRPQTPYQLRLTSWNVNGVRAIHKKNLLPFLMENNPDILCLQETKAHPDQLNEEIQRLQYPQSFWSWAQRKGYSGVATFVRQPIPEGEVSKGLGLPRYDTEGRFVITRHPIQPKMELALYNIYFPNGGSGPERHAFKQDFLGELFTHLKGALSRGEFLIVAGDYNIAHSELDIYDPIGLAQESGFLPEERAWFDAFLEMGFVDSFRHFHPTTNGKYTWWAYRSFARPVNRGWRIDYICISKNLLPYLSSAQIWTQVEGSDHCPISIELDFSPLFS